MPERGAKIQQVFVNVDMRCGMDGLIKITSDNNIDVTKRKHGELLIFINTGWNKIKVMACNESDSPVIAQKYLRHGRVFSLNIVREIPRAFKGSGEIDFNEAMERAFIKSLPSRMQKMIEEGKVPG